MTVIKKKVSRKEQLNQPDAFIGAANEAAEWYSTHKKQVITVTAIGCAAILGVWGALQLINHNKYVSSADYFQVTKALDANVGDQANYVTGISAAERQVQRLSFTNEEDREKVLLEALDKAIAANTSNEVGQLSRLRKAIALQDQSKDKEAIEILNAYLAKSSLKDSFHFIAIEHLGYALEATGDYAAASAEFAKLANAADTSMKEASDYHVARMAVLQNDAAKAKELFQKVIDNTAKDSVSAFAELAKKQLAAIN